METEKNYSWWVGKICFTKMKSKKLFISATNSNALMTDRHAYSSSGFQIATFPGKKRVTTVF